MYIQTFRLFVLFVVGGEPRCSVGTVNVLHAVPLQVFARRDLGPAGLKSIVFICICISGRPR